MGWRDMFKKESECENCRIILPKKQLAVFDTTLQGKNKSGQYKKVCKSCMLQLFYTSLREYNSPAVVIHPIKDLNSYVFYNFDELSALKDASSREENENLIREMKELLPSNETQCSCCQNKASYTWCSAELLYNDPYCWEVNKDDKLEFFYLCKDCLIREFNKKVEEEKIEIQCVYPPISGQGFCTSWDT